MASPTTRSDLLGRALTLEYTSLAYNVAEAVVGMILGLAAGSVALVGFALDSVVESSSASILIWRLRAERSGKSSSEELERRAVRLVAGAFFALAAYVGVRSAYDLITSARPEGSLPGMVLAAVSVAVMPLLAWRKRTAAGHLDSRFLHADSKQTTLCAYLSVFLLIGVGANSLLGWWWADPLAGLAIAGVAIDEGRELGATEDFC